MSYSYYSMDDFESEVEVVKIKSVSPPSATSHSGRQLTSTSTKHTDAKTGTSVEATIVPSETPSPPLPSKQQVARSQRAAGDHSFTIANMFGPIGWAFADSDSESDSDGESVIDSKQDTENESAIVVKRDAKPYVGKAVLATVTELPEPCEHRHTAYVCEANMFGPMDWAVEAWTALAATGESF